MGRSGQPAWPLEELQLKRPILSWTITLMLGFIIACGGSQEARTVPLPPILEYSGGQTSAVSPLGAPTIDGSPQSTAGGTPTVGTESPSVPVVTLGGVQFRVELAVTSAERIRGLSGHPLLAADAGMLFVFEQARKPSFWMREMLFPLDMIWIDADCTVVHITRGAPPQALDQSLSDLPRYGPPVAILYVLEINAGRAESAAITVGSPARFDGSLTGRYGC